MKYYSILISFLFTFYNGYSQWESMNGPYGGYINELITNDTIVFAASTNGLYKSSDYGKEWRLLSFKNGVSYACLGVAFRGTMVIADAVNFEQGELKRKLFRSDNSGEAWIEIARPNTISGASVGILSNRIYLTDYNQIWVSFDNGNSWILSSFDATQHPFYEFHVYDDIVYLMTYEGRIFRCEELVDHFYNIDPVGAPQLSELFVDGNLMFAEGADGRLYRSENVGQLWKLIQLQLNGAGKFTKIGNSYFTKNYSTIFKSEDLGLTWVDQHSVHLPGSADLMLGSGGILLLSFSYRGIETSNDLGVSFTSSNLGLSATFSSSLLISDDTLLVGSLAIGISEFDIRHSSWDISPTYDYNSDVTDFLKTDNGIYAVLTTDVIKSTKSNHNWDAIFSEKIVPPIQSLYSRGDRVLVGGYSSFLLYYSDNAGLYWDIYQCNVNGELEFPKLFASNGNILFTATINEIFRSLDNGISWDTVMQGLTLEDESSKFFQLYDLNDILFAIEYTFTSGEHYRLHVSYDNGDHWHLSDDGLPTDQNTNGIISLTNYNGILIASLRNHESGVYVSYDNAMTWKPFYEGLPFGDMRGIIFDTNYLYAASQGQGVWKRKISDLYTTSTNHPIVKNEISIFPNPSNGNFTLTINSNSHERAQLTISDLNGKIFMNENIDLAHELNIEAKNLTSGLYILTLKTNKRIYITKIVMHD